MRRLILGLLIWIGCASGAWAQVCSYDNPSACGAPGMSGLAISPKLPGYANPLTITVPALTGICTNPDCATAHPRIVEFQFGSLDTPDTMSGIPTTGSTLDYINLDYYFGGPGATGTRGGMRLHGALVGPANPGDSSNTTVVFGGLAEILQSMGGTSPVRPNAKGAIYFDNGIVRLAGDAASARGTSTGTTDLTTVFTAGTIHVGDTVVAAAGAPGVPPNTTIVSQTSGTTGGDGVYVTSNPTTLQADALVIGSFDPTTNARNIRAIGGIELDTSLEAGSTLAVKAAITAGSFFNDQARGTEFDAAFNVSATAGAIGFNYAYAVSDVGGKFPMGKYDTVLGLVNLSGVGIHILNGFDATAVNIDGNFLASKKFVVTGGGQISTFANNLGVVPAVDGSLSELVIDTNFSNAFGEAVFWNGHYIAAKSFDFRQITSAGVSQSVLSITPAAVIVPGNLIVSNLPTSSPLTHCTLWNNSNIVQVSTCP